MLDPEARVIISLEWLNGKLCRIHGRSSVSRVYLHEVYTEVIHQLEADLNAGRPVSIEIALLVTIDTLDCPYTILGP